MEELNKLQPVTVVSTGGTIEKTYDEEEGNLSNRGPVIQEIIEGRLRLPHTKLEVFSLMNKDSLEMTDGDRLLLSTFIKERMPNKAPIVVLHGTDTMALSAQYCQQKFPQPLVAVVFTGAMRPIGLENSDALQNVAEAILASTLLSPGIYISFHGRVFTLPGVRKNTKKGTFEKTPSSLS